MASSCPVTVKHTAVNAVKSSSWKPPKSGVSVRVCVCATRSGLEVKAVCVRNRWHWQGSTFSASQRKEPAYRQVHARYGDDLTSFDSPSDVDDPRSGYSSAEEEDKQPDLDLADARDDGELSRAQKEGQAKAAEKGTMSSAFYEVSSIASGGHKERVGEGIWLTALLSVSLCGTLLLFDSYIWRVIRRPLASLYLTYPFVLSAILTGYLGYISVPLLKRIKARQIFREEIQSSHLSKVGTPTMGGLFFVPVGIGVARLVTGFASNEILGVAVATFGFAAIGLLDDGLTAWRNAKYGLPGWMKFVLQVACGTWFAFWLDSAGLPSPYKMKTLVPLPPPLGLWYCGKWYLPLTVFCFAAMSNGVNLTDGLDGLAAGTAAIAFTGMAIAVLPIYPALGVFGASMAGACVGFLVHNRYKATVFMGDTGSLALGAGLAAMAACTGMFLPLFIASGVFVIETVSVVGQVGFFKFTKRMYGQGRRWLRMAPFHHHLELVGMKEPYIIAVAYALAICLAFAAAYVALISA